MVVFLACADLIKVFNKSFQYGFYISFLLTFTILTYGYIQNLRTVKQVINIAINKSVPQRNKLKIVAVSDWHLGYGTDYKRLIKDVDLINAEKPDVILIAGDLIDNSITPVIAQGMEKELNRLHASSGIFMAPGNHEYISGINQCIKFIGQTNSQLLRDSVITLPCGLQIIGRDDYSNRKRLSADDWANLIDPSKPVILIDHQPYHLEDAQKMKADLKFSGHTHNGQFFPFNLVTNYLFEISYGYKKTGDTHYYVTSGISLWGPPFRIGTRSEIVVFECSFAK
jgi:predicted MPP superfamily phosphohydrolase